MPESAHVPTPGGLGGAATLFVLVVPALAGAYLGFGAAAVRRLPRQSLKPRAGWIVARFGFSRTG